MQAILISVGGTGGVILNEIRRMVDIEVAADLAIEAAEARERSLRFFLLDTRRELHHSLFASQSLFEIPSSQEQSGVDELVSAFDEYDSDFQDWWPRARGGAKRKDPYLPGDFVNGAGQVRVKGRLAYRIHLTQSAGSHFIDAIKAAVDELRNVLEPVSQNSAKLPVYLISSLGGGTGSGIVPTLAHHLRKELPRNCPIIGVFLLASVTEFVFGGQAQASDQQDRVAIWANTDAALREIDHFQLHATSRRGTADKVTPYLRWRRQEIVGDVPPFEYVYLFSRHNRDGFTLPTFHHYLRLVAECLHTELMSPLTTAIQEKDSQFTQRFNEMPVLHGRSTRYASAGKAEVVYPVQRITSHLARRFAARVIRERLQPPADSAPEWAPQSVAAGREAASALLNQYNLFWSAGTDLKSVLGRYDDDDEPEPRPLRIDVETDPFGRADRDRSIDLIRAKKRDFEEWRTSHFQPKVQSRAEGLNEVMTRAPLRALVKLVDDELAARSGDGYLRARAAVDHLLNLLNEQRKLVSHDLTGTSDAPGLKWWSEQRNDEFDQQLADFRRLAGSRSQGRTHGRAAKVNYLEWEQVFRNNEKQYDIAMAAQGLYDQLLTETRQVQIELNRLDGVLRNLTTELDADADQDLGAIDQGGVMEIGVLDRPELVDYHFRTLMADVNEKQASHVARELLVAQDGIRDTLKIALARKGGDGFGEREEATIKDRLVDALVTAAGKFFEPEVARLNVWQAMKAECEARLANRHLIDQSLQNALDAVRRIASERKSEGVTSGGISKELLGKYVEERLKDCRKRALPFWSLDSQAINTLIASDVEKPYQMTVVAYNHDVYDAYLRQEGISDVVPAISGGSRGNAAKIDSPNKIMVYIRDGIAPLFFLDRDELRTLSERAAEVSRSKLIYTDQRFEGVIDPVISRGEAFEDTVRYAIAAGLHFEIIQVDRDGVGQNGHTPTATTNRQSWNARRGLGAPGDLIAMQRLYEEDRDKFDALAASVDECWARLNEKTESPDVLRRMQTWAEEQADESLDREERRWWTELRRILKLRLEQQRYFVGWASQSRATAEASQSHTTAEANTEQNAAAQSSPSAAN